MATPWLRGRRPRNRSRDFRSGRVERVEAERQVDLRLGHWRGLDDGSVTIARQDRERQQVAAAKVAGQRRDVRVGLQVGALDIDVGDAGAAGAGHLVARADDVAAGTQLDLRGPAEVGQQGGDVERDGGEWADGVAQRHGVLGAHPVERDGAGRDRRGVAVLQPQHDALIVARGG